MSDIAAAAARPITSYNEIMATAFPFSEKRPVDSFMRHA